MRKRISPRVGDVIKASELDGSHFFRKKTGEYVYKVISSPAAKYLNLRQNETIAYGVSASGNVARVDHEKEVVLCSFNDFGRCVSGWENPADKLREFADQLELAGAYAEYEYEDDELDK